MPDVFDPFAVPAPAASSGEVYDPFAAGAATPAAPEKEGALGYLGKQVKSAFYGGVRGAGATLQAPAEMTGSEPGLQSQIGKSMEEYGKAGEASIEQQSNPEDQNALVRGAGFVAKTIGGALPLLAASTVGSELGGAAGSVVAPGPGTVAGAVVGGAAGGASQAALQAYHEAYHQALDAGKSDAEARAYASDTATNAGVAMGAFGGVAGGIGRIGGMLARAVGGAAETPVEAAANVVSKSTLPEFVKGGAELLGANQIVGAGQTAAQAEINKEHGIGEEQTPWEAVKAGAAETLASGAAFLPFALHGALRSASQSKAVAAALSDPNAPVADRARAAMLVTDAVDKVNPEAAKHFSDYAIDALTNKRKIETDASKFLPAATVTINGEAPAAPLGLPNRPEDTLYAFPDGSERRMSEIEHELTKLPVDQRDSARAAAMFGARPVVVPFEKAPEGSLSSAANLSLIPKEAPIDDVNRTGAGSITGNVTLPGGKEVKAPTGEGMLSYREILGLPFIPNDKAYVFPDGSTGTQSQIDAYIKGIPEEKRIEARAKMMQGAKEIPDEAVSLAHQIEENNAIVQNVAKPLSERSAAKAKMAEAQAKINELMTEPEKEAKNAVRKSSPGKVLQRESGSVGKAGGERGRVEQGEQRPKTSNARKTSAETRSAPAEEVKTAEPEVLMRVGRTPNAAANVTVKDGIIHMDGEPAIDHESGEPIKAPKGASAPDVREALVKAGAVTKNDKFFGAKAAAAPEAKPQKKVSVQTRRVLAEREIAVRVRVQELERAQAELDESPHDAALQKKVETALSSVNEAMNRVNEVHEAIAREGMKFSEVANESPKLAVDNPGGKWLAEKREDNAAEGKTAYGVPKRFGPVTAAFKGKVLLPVSLLRLVDGMRGEQHNVREKDLASLTKYMGENKRLPPFDPEAPEHHYAPFIMVDQNGMPWVNEGNHRIMAAAQLRAEYLPVEVRYFSGGEQIDGAFSPKKLLRLDADARASGKTETNYFSENTAPVIENPHSVDTAIKAAADAHAGKDRSALQALMSSGAVKIISAEDALKLTGNERAAAFYNPADKTTYIVADRIPKAYTAQEWRGLIRHEVSVHAFQLGKSSKEFQDILRQFDMMRKAGNPAAVDAFNRVPESTAAGNVREEALAYLVQHSPDLGIVQRVVAWFRNTLRQMGLGKWAGPLSVNDILSMAQKAMADRGLAVDHALQDVYRVPIGMNTAHGSPLGDNQPISSYAVRRIVNRAAELTGVKIVGQQIASGSYLGDREGNLVLDVAGTRQARAQFAAMVGLAAHQTEVISIKDSPTGKTQGVTLIDGIGNTLHNPDAAERFMNAVRDKMPEGSTIANGYQMANIDGKPALRMLKGEWDDEAGRVNWTGKWTPEELAAFDKVFKEVANEQGIAKLSRHVEQYDLDSQFNDWNKNPNGEAYRGILDARGGALRTSGDRQLRLLSHEVGPTSGRRSEAGEILTSGPHEAFYSQLRRAVRDASDKVFATPAQVSAWLNANAGKLGVKKDEIEYSGINDWLAMQKGKVTKDDVLAYLDQNGVKVEDVTLERKDTALSQELTDWLYNNGYHGRVTTPARWIDVANEIERKANVAEQKGDLKKSQKLWDLVHEATRASEGLDENGSRSDPTRYGQYTVPGGSDYKELLLTLPVKNKQTAQQRYRELTEQGMPAIDALNEAHAMAPAFQSNHFEQPNILAHIRFDTRTDADGNRVLFINEIQSDWGQKGKREGFVSNGMRTWDAIQNEISTLDHERIALLKRAAELPDEKMPEFVSAMDRVKSINERVAGLKREQDVADKRVHAIPSGPFVTDTKAWVGLALKRMIRYAADNGFDKIAIINGDQAANLYDLSKHIDSVGYEKRGDTYNVAIFGKNNEKIYQDQSATVDDLEAHVGKELTKKIVNGEGTQNGPLKYLEGLDLKVGGEGMRGFYDQIVPQVANDVLRKIGVGKTEMSPQIMNENVRFKVATPDIGTAEDAGGGYWKGSKGQAWDNFSTIDITPELRNRVLNQGLPLFSEISPREAIAKAAAKLKDNDAVAAVDLARDGLMRAIMPQYRTADAREVARVLTQGLGEKEMQSIKFKAALDAAAKEHDASVTTAQKARDLIEKGLTVAADRLFLRNTPEKNHAFMQAMDTGDTAYFNAHPEMASMAREIARMFDSKVAQVQALDTGALTFLRDNYFPHIWKREPDGNTQQQIFASLSKRPLEGSKGFAKNRVFDDFKAGVDAGFEPISNNPLDIVMLKMEEMDKYILAHKTLQSLESTDAVHLLPAGERTPRGYTDVNGRYGNIDRDVGNGVQKLRYVARDDVAQVINNYLSPNLYHNKYVGGPFSAYMNAANTLNQFQLGVFSAFHAGFTSFEAVISHASVGLAALSRGDLKGAAKYLAEAPAAWVNNPRMGSKIIEEMMHSGTHPEMASIIEGLQLAGFKWQMDTRFRTDSTKKMLEAWQEGRGVVAAGHSLNAVVEQSARPIVEWLVPRQKFGVFGEMYSKWMHDHPNATHEELRNSAQQIWNRVDSRLGQVVYDRLFVHNVAKNFAQMLIRAPGWTGGTILEVGGGIKDLAKYALNPTKAGITDRAAYTLSLLMTTAICNSIITAMFTGDGPKDWRDMVAFRTGNLDENGNPERFMLPTYMKDVYAYSQHPAMTLVHKSHPLLSLAGDLIANRDYFGTEIRSEDDSLFTQMAQTANYTAKAFVPFWMRGVQKEVQREATPMATALPIIGIMPAPSGINQTAAEKLMSQYGTERLPQGGRTQADADKLNALRDIYVKLRKGEKDKAFDLFMKAKADGLVTYKDYARAMRESIKDPLSKSFDRLTFEQAKRVMDVATPEEKSELNTAFLRKTLKHRQELPAP